MNKLKVTLIVASYLVTIAATAIVTIKLYDEFLKRKILLDTEQLRMVERQNELEIREKRIAVEKAEWEDRMAARKTRQQIEMVQAKADLEYRQTAALLKENQLESQKKALELNNAQQRAELEARTVTNRRRVGKVCDEQKCVYQVEIVEQTYYPILRTWKISNVSKATETEMLTANQAQ